ncbi:hypothetical protein ABZ858_05890 [Streptomyces sp. NPDC047017]|uniref:hypothetical protein n=1 Tax=Streptomyces sp. NPDC047017 TaxID=3155024 RepID=UPI003408AA4D
MEAWEDGDCPWCHSLLGSGPVLAEADTGCPAGWFRAWDGLLTPVRAECARLLIVPMAALAMVAALLAVLA